LISLGALTIPLGMGLLDVVTQRRDKARLTKKLEASLEARVEAHPQTSLVSVSRSHTHEEVEIVLAGPGAPPQELIDDLARIVGAAHGHPVPVRVITIRRSWIHTSIAPVDSKLGAGE